jgi:hypothetical protein
MAPRSVMMLICRMSEAGIWREIEMNSICFLSFRGVVPGLATAVPKREKAASGDAAFPNSDGRRVNPR